LTGNGRWDGAGGICIGLVLVGVAGFLAVGLAACGADSYPNDPKPPAVLTVSVLIGEQEIVVSPKEFGAGPTRFVVTNQTGTDQTFAVSGERVEKSAAVAPQQTADFKVVTEAGALTLDADNTAADALDLTVGPERPSAQQDLDQP
jgi:hypothetical protein